jgi:hypothetical protein
MTILMRRPTVLSLPFQLVFPACGDKHSSLFFLVVSDEKKSFHDLDDRARPEPTVIWTVGKLKPHCGFKTFFSF